MIQLGSTVLNPNLIWTDRDSYSPVRQQAEATLGGLRVNWAQAMTGARPITLEAVEDQGWFTKEQKDAVVVMAASAGGVYTLTIGAETFQVIFRHDEPPAAAFSSLIPRAVDLAGDYFTGLVKLVTL